MDDSRKIRHYVTSKALKTLDKFSFNILYLSFLQHIDINIKKKTITFNIKFAATLNSV